MAKKLIILSDLWGNKMIDWISLYTSVLTRKYEITFYDCCNLGNIDNKDLSENSIHNLFINGDVDKAVKKLIELETNNVDIIAFSIGGTIVWKAGLNGLKIDYFYAVSSTRLRYEIEKPNCNIKLVYGKKDKYIPNKEWFSNLGLDYKLISNESHLIYKKKDFVLNLSNKIIAL